MDSKNAFIAKSIDDIQLTVRAIDVKIGALLAGIIVPFSSFGRIWAHFHHIRSVLPWEIGLILWAIFFLMWFCTIFILVRGLSAIDNPALHIVNAGKYTGSFYGGGLYTFGFLDAMLNRSIVKASKDVSTFSADLPNSKDEISDELVFEQLKLIYIRDIKLFRLNIGIKLAGSCLFIGFLSFVISKLN